MVIISLDGEGLRVEPKKSITESRGRLMNGREQIEPADIGKLLAVARHPRDAAFFSLLAHSGARISEVVGLRVQDIHFDRGLLTIKHLKERSKLKCPHCGESLGKKHLFCPACGNKVGKAIREASQKERTRTIPIDTGTLQLLREYLQWRRQFRYRGQLVFPFSRQRGWQIIRALGHRAGIQGLKPHSLRHLLATSWVNRGLSTKKLQVMLGHESIATTFEYVDTNVEQLRAEYDKLWAEDGTEG